MKLVDVGRIVLPPLLVLFVSDIAVRFDLYERYAEFDVGMHAFGGAAIAFSWLLFERAALPKKFEQPWWYRVLVTLGIVALAGTFWEFYEFVLDEQLPLPLRQLTIVDTMGDYAADLLGGLMVVGARLLCHMPAEPAE